MQVASRQCVWKTTPVPSCTSFYATVGAATCNEARLGRVAKAGGSASVTVHWGDGEKSVAARGWAAGDMRHTYAKPGTYLVRISNDVETFGLSAYSGSNPYNDVFRGRTLVSLGTRVTAIAPLGFMYVQLPGVLSLPTVRSIGARAFDHIYACSEVDAPLLERLERDSFIWCTVPAVLRCDGVKHIDADFFGDGTITYNGFRQIYIGGLTPEEIRAMDGFPFGASSAVVFHGSDGIVEANGTIRR